ncbi:MAG: flippase, partial [Thermococcus sp.]|nr:flippase [Thermococcus sp.]
MSEASQALQRIARGTGIVFAGTVISMFFMFLSRALIARCFAAKEYGVFNLALAVFSISLVIATLGLQSSLPREVAVYREKRPSQLWDLVSTAIVILSFNGTLLALLLSVEAENVALVLHESELVEPLKIIAFALPFSALTSGIIAISRGFGRVRERVYFKDIFFPVSFFVLLLIGVFLKLGFLYVFFVYSVSQILALAFLLFDVRRIGLIKFRLAFVPQLGKELIVFSLPLMLTGILGFIMTRTDTLMLGYYEGSEIVGIYNAAAPLAGMLPIFLNSAGFLYVPIASRLYAQGKLGELGRVYQILTKWVFLLTLPLFSVMFLFPEATINFFFGAKYVGASRALQILALGFMFHTFLGLNGMSLTVIGEPRLNLIGNSFAAALNVVLNALLIPAYGLEGAAVATAVSYFVANVFRSFWLYKKTKIHPFSWNYVKPLVISFVLLGLVRSLHLRVPNIWYAVPVLVVFLGV